MLLCIPMIFYIVELLNDKVKINLSLSIWKTDFKNFVKRKNLFETTFLCTVYILLPVLKLFIISKSPYLRGN